MNASQQSHSQPNASYRRWSLWIAAALAALLALLWWLGYGPNRGACCIAAAPAQATPVAIAPPVVPAAPEPIAPKVAAAPDPCVEALRADVSFNSGSVQLSAAGKQALDAMASCIQAKGATITGHTDNVGKPASNQTLSERRAQSVKAYLVSKTVAADLLTAAGKGDTSPIADNASTEGRAKNRRMEIVAK